MDAWKSHVLTLWPEAEPVVRQIAGHHDLTFAVYRHSWPRNLARAPYCVIGDAAHAMSPQLGLGATLAVQDALALAGALQSRGAHEGLEAYARRRLFPSRAYQTLSRALTPCFQAAGGGLWRDVAFAAGRHVPGVPWLMKRSVAEAVGRKG
jgi:2-polyprenyl-6-methoxyphenol hydroxylase-like FAD-dependent oxidoreductase